MFLSTDELHQLTGSRRRTAQLRWLAAAGWKFTTDYKGKPVVMKAEAEKQLVSGEQAEAKSAIRWDRVA